MIDIVRVNVVSRDRVFQVGAVAYGALARACARARSIEGGEGTVGSAQEAVIDVARIYVQSCDRPRWVEAIDDCDLGALVKACARARSFKCREGTVGLEQVAAKGVARLNVDFPRSRLQG